MADQQLVDDILELGWDIFATKLFWVSISTLWAYEYLLTLPDEVKYAWRGSRRTSIVFVLYLINRYFVVVVVVVTLLSSFYDGWTVDTCSRYGPMKIFELFVTSTVAEIFLTLRVYALTGKRRLVLIASFVWIAVQAALLIYIMSRAHASSADPALLLAHPIDPLPQVAQIPVFHICFFISIWKTIPQMEAWLAMSLIFDGLAFATIMNDGIIYFFLLFATNFAHIMLARYARESLKFIHGLSASIVTSIMINRITINLKRAATHDTLETGWSMRTFENHTYMDSTSDDRVSNLRFASRSKLNSTI